MMKNLFSRAMGSCVWGVLPAALAGCLEVPKWETSLVASEPGGAATGGGLDCEEYGPAGGGSGGGDHYGNGNSSEIGAGNVDVNVTGDSNVTNVNVEVNQYGYGGYYYPGYYYGPYAYSQPYYGYGPYWGPVTWSVPAVPAVPARTIEVACGGDGVQEAPRVQGRLIAHAGASLVQSYRALRDARISSLEIRASSKQAAGTGVGLYRGGSSPEEGELIATAHRPDRVDGEGEILVFDFPELPAVESGENVFVVVSNPYEAVSIGASRAKRTGDILEADGIWIEIGGRVLKEQSYREIAAVIRYEADCHAQSDTVAGL